MRRAPPFGREFLFDATERRAYCRRVSASTAPVPSLYVHVPFCAHKCEYCAFFSETSDGETINRYAGALVRELELVAPDLKPATIFFGGGTPSLLNLRQWGEILRALDRLGLLGAAEWTIESNPATVSADKAKLWRDHGVNRVSLGVQSLDEALLDRLGRVHSRAMVFRSFDTLRRAGFDNLNVDLMFAIPGQTLATWRATLDEALALGSEHLSCYEVIYEEDTPLYEQLQAGRFDVDEALACAMYDELLERAAAAGLVQYEVANFARDQREGREQRSDGLTNHGGLRLPAAAADGLPIPSRACRHNVNYWRGGSFHGLGPSAAGFVRGVRTKNWSNTRLYCEQLERGRRAIESREELPPLRRAGEIAAFGLRLTAGWPFVEFQQTTGFDLRREWRAEMGQLVAQGWGALEPDRFRLTPQGLRFADSAAELFLR
jgi:oxygen-independent coproporphyrinogen-3 oxidase